MVFSLESCQVLDSKPQLNLENVNTSAALALSAVERLNS